MAGKWYKKVARQGGETREDLGGNETVNVVVLAHSPQPEASGGPAF